MVKKLIITSAIAILGITTTAQEKKVAVYRPDAFAFDFGAGVGQSANYFMDYGIISTKNRSPYFGFDILKLKFAYINNQKLDFAYINNDQKLIEKGIFSDIYSCQFLTGIRLYIPRSVWNIQTNFYFASRIGIGSVHRKYKYDNEEDANYYAIFVPTESYYDRFAPTMEIELGLHFKYFHISVLQNYFYKEDRLFHKEDKRFYKEDKRYIFGRNSKFSDGFSWGVRIGIDFGELVSY